jgi:hypothetical protein
MVFPNKRKIFAKSVLALYVFISVTFPLAHNDYVALDVRLSLSPIDSNCNSLDSNTNDLVCPAHNFAQSTTGTAALIQDFSPTEDVAVLRVEQHDHLFAAPANDLSTRAPPQA